MILEREDGRRSATQLSVTTELCNMTTPPVVFVDLPRMASCGPISQLRKTFMGGGPRPFIVSSNCLRRRVADCSPYEGPRGGKPTISPSLFWSFVMYTARSCASLACKDGGARTDPRIYHGARAACHAFP
jgi:hypothetical protein